MYDLIIAISTRVCSPAHHNLLLQCVESVERFVGLSNKVKIVVVDSDSSDKSYMAELSKNRHVYIEDIGNTGYEATAFYYAFKRYDAEKYLFLQDSMTLEGCLPNSNIAIMRYLNTWECANDRIISIVTKWFENTKWKTTPANFSMVQFSSFMAKRKILKHLESMGFYNNLPSGSPGGKDTAESYERYLGAALTAAGYEQEMRSNIIPHSKIFVGRQ